jgi:hypothetical protein
VTVLAAGVVLTIFLFSAWHHASVGEACARAMSLALALGATAASIFFWDWGQHSHWRGDGPGVLVIMFALSFWGMLAFLLVWPALIGPQRDDPPRDPAARRAALVSAAWAAFIGLAAVALLGFFFSRVLPKRR